MKIKFYQILKKEINRFAKNKLKVSDQNPKRHLGQKRPIGYLTRVKTTYGAEATRYRCFGVSEKTAKRFATETIFFALLHTNRNRKKHK